MKALTVGKMMALVLLVMCALVLQPAKAEAQKPDLTIVNVVESGTTARILVRNIGAVASPGCVLRVYRWVPGWMPFAGAAVPALPIGGSVWISVTAAPIAMAPTLYVVDAGMTVAESDENNNRYLVP